MSDRTVRQVYEEMSAAKRLTLQIVCGGMLTDDVDPDNIAVLLKSHMTGLTEEEEKASTFIVGQIYKELQYAKRMDRRRELRKNAYLYMLMTIYDKWGE